MLRDLNILSAYSLAGSLRVPYSHLARKTATVGDSRDTFDLEGKKGWFSV